MLQSRSAATEALQVDAGDSLGMMRGGLPLVNAEPYLSELSSSITGAVNGTSRPTSGCSARYSSSIGTPCALDTCKPDAPAMREPGAPGSAASAMRRTSAKVSGFVVAAAAATVHSGGGRQHSSSSAADAAVCAVCTCGQGSFSRAELVRLCQRCPNWPDRGRRAAPWCADPQWCLQVSACHCFDMQLGSIGIYIRHLGAIAIAVLVLARSLAPGKMGRAARHAAADAQALR